MWEFVRKLHRENDFQFAYILAIGFEDLVLAKVIFPKITILSTWGNYFVWMEFDLCMIAMPLSFACKSSQKTQSFFVESEGRGLSTISILKPVLKWVIVWFLLFI